MVANSQASAIKNCAVIVPDTTTPPQNPAEANCLEIAQAITDIKSNYLKLGYLLWHNRENAYWQAHKCESFFNFVEQFGISYSWATRLIDTAVLVAKHMFTAEDVAEIGPEKMALLLPAVKKDNLPEGVLEIAKHGTTKDLRLKLGHKLEEPTEGDEVHCPHCGVKLYGLKFATKDREVDYEGKNEDANK